MFSKRSFLAFIGMICLTSYCFWHGKVIMGVVIYLLLNIIFTKMPWLLHAQRTKFKIPFTKLGFSHMLIAHRGGSWEAPENTL